MDSALPPAEHRRAVRRPRALSNLLLVRRRTRLRDGGCRRHHAPDRKRPVDYRMEAGQRRHPAADPGRLAARLRSLQADPAISRSRRPGGNDARRASSSSSSGNGCIGCSAESSGLVFFVGVGWFAVRRAIPQGLTAGGSSPLFVLGGLQGAVGWFMVMSGLEGRTEVSPYRLSAHLLFALFLFAALIWTALDLRRSQPAAHARRA